MKPAATLFPLVLLSAGVVVTTGAPPVLQKHGTGLILQAAPGEFIVAGHGFSVRFSPRTPGLRYNGILQIDEGGFVNGRWQPRRRLNGGETGANWQAKLPPFDGGTFSNPANSVSCA